MLPGLPDPQAVAQPIVENAIHYGAECSLEPCRILVRARLSERGLWCMWRMTGPAFRWPSAKS